MMKKKTKWIALSELDIKSLKQFLNQQAKLGWVVTKISQFRVVFEYDQDNTKHYSVTDHLFLKNYPDYVDFQKQKEFEQFIQEYDYKLLARAAGFEIYESSVDVDLFSENRESIEFLTVYGERLRKRYVYGLILFGLYLLMFLSVENKYSLFYQSTFVISIVVVVFILFGLIKGIIQSNQFRDGKYYQNHYKFKSKNSDPVSVLTILLFVGFGLFVLYNFLFVDHQKYAFIVIVLMIILTRQIFFGIEMKKSNKVKLTVIISLIGLILYLNMTSGEIAEKGLLVDQVEQVSKLEYFNQKLEGQACVYKEEESFMGMLIDYYCFDDQINILIQKSDLFNEYTRDQFLNHRYLTKENQVPDDRYIYQDDRAIIVSDNPIDLTLQKEIKDLFKE